MMVKIARLPIRRNQFETGALTEADLSRPSSDVLADLNATLSASPPSNRGEGK